MKNKNSNQEEFDLPLHKPFTVQDLPKDPKNAAERVLVFCVMLFQTSNKPVVILNDPYDQTQTAPNSFKMRFNRGRISSNASIYDINHLTEPRGEGACDAFERDLNSFENDMLGEDYSDNWE